MSAILLIENDSAEAELAFRAFKTCKLSGKFVLLRDGAEALDYLFGTGKYAGMDNSLEPTLVLLDLNLPKVDGMEVLKLIRSNQKTRSLPVVILTSSDQDVDITKAYKLGCNSYMIKPISFTEFTQKIQQLLVYWLSVNTWRPQGESAQSTV